MKKLQNISSLLFFLIGLVLLSFVIRRFGGWELWETFSQIGWKIIFILILPLSWYMAQALAWYVVMEETGQHVSYWSLLNIKLSGESINTLTPVSWMGGDPVRIMMLRKRMPGTLSTAATVLDRTMQSLAVVVFLLIGLSVAWLTIDLPQNWEYVFPGLTLLLIVMVAFFIYRQKKGIFKHLTKILDLIGLKRLNTTHLQEKTEALDKRIAQFYGEHPQRFLQALGLHVLGRLLGVLEIFYIAQFLGIPLGLSGALLLASLTVLVNMMFVFIPGSIGVMEGAYGAILHVLGQEAVAGVAIQLVRRLRTIFWIFVGLVLMLIYTKLNSGSPVSQVHQNESAS